MRPSLEATCLPAGGQSDIQLVLEFECTLCDGPEEGGSSDESTAASSSTRPRPVRGDDDPNTGLLFSIDLHSHQPWVLCGRYSREDCCFGWRFEHCDSLEVWNYEDGTRVASVKIADHPDVIVAKFIPQKNWIATKYFESLVVYEIQAPDLHCVTTFELPAGEPLPWEVGEHPSVCYMLTGAEDVVVLWNGDKEWEQITFGRKKREEQKVDRSGRDFDRGRRHLALCKNSNGVVVLNKRGKLLLLKIVRKGRNKEFQSKANIQTAAVFAERPQTQMPPINEPPPPPSDEPPPAVSKKRVVGKMEDKTCCGKPERETEIPPVDDEPAAPASKKRVVVNMEDKTCCDESPAAASKKRVVGKMEENTCCCGKPEWEKIIRQKMADMEMKCMKAVKELREEHAERVQKLEDDFKLKWSRAVNELREEHAKSLQKLGDDLEECGKAVKELQEEHTERPRKQS
ncbi:hypothetical protein CBR_g36491 [Chara braunii]|uniref:Uncharacterized protein n=1 Tax=Chara braunii TaxID=69332 RepID=A0A388LL69_CHABU|nr:hypothetical protein CBR_g36491 [Chara braunii]|eukprot:GBG82965.1 hypothetical protein CBR_g36491 [Chara braunii]